LEYSSLIIKEITFGTSRILRDIEKPRRQIAAPGLLVRHLCSKWIKSSFEHVLDQETAFREIHRVLKPGGGSIHAIPFK
jgi:hypothetical protein